MHFEKNNLRKNYCIENEGSKVWLEKTEVEKDLGEWSLVSEKIASK